MKFDPIFSQKQWHNSTLRKDKVFTSTKPSNVKVVEFEDVDSNKQILENNLTNPTLNIIPPTIDSVSKVQML